MAGATAGRRDTGATSSWSRALACLLALCLAFLAPMSAGAETVHPVPAAAHVGSVAAGDMAGRHAPEDGSARHCAHCACHQVIPAPIGFSRLSIPSYTKPSYPEAETRMVARSVSPLPEPPRS